MPVKDRSTGPEVNLRLVWPQWQGGGTVSVQQLASEFPLDIGRRGYAVGSAVLEAVLPPHDGPTASVPVTMTDEGLAERDGMEAKVIVLEQLARALEVIGQHNPARIATLGVSAR
jgi:arginase